MALFEFGPKKAALDAQRRAQELQRNIYGQQKAAYQPYQDIAKQSVSDYADYYKSGGWKFDPSNVMMDDPGYEFRRKEGMRGLENSAMARGGLLSGNAIRAAQNYGQNLASQEYQNAYNRQYQNFLNELNQRNRMLNWGQGTAQDYMDILAADPRVAQEMNRARQLASESKGIGSALGNIGLGALTGGWGGAGMALGSGLLGQIF